MDRRLLLQALRCGLAAVLGSRAGRAAAQSQSATETPSRAVFFDAALSIFSHSTRVLAFKFQKPVYAETPELTLKDLKDMPKPRELDEHARSFLVGKLSDAASYVFGLQKPMQFYADYGLVFEGGVPNVLLISTSSKSARLVLERPLDPANFIVNIDPLFPALADQLRTALQ